jgi:ubiquitin carboxyl-terminal hydrolase 22/27/51
VHFREVRRKYYAGLTKCSVTDFVSEGFDQQLHGCMECGLIDTRGRLKEHSVEENHMFLLHVRRGQLYCMRCRDYFYDHHFDLESEKVEVECALSIPRKTVSAVDKRKREEGHADWMRENAIHHRPIPTQIVGHRGVMGLRGLCNMGSTCFMNSVLQTLAHNPVFRDYFLSDCHNHNFCDEQWQAAEAMRANGKGNGSGGSGGIASAATTFVGSDGTSKRLCLGCDMDKFFMEMFSEKSDRTTAQPPAVPHSLLYSMWHHAQHLAGYDQQDAHEFLMSLLDGIHAHTHPKVHDVKCQSPRRGREGVSTCDCVVHRTFSGTLRSDLTCKKCAHVSSSFDPFLDISLSINEHRGPMNMMRAPSPGSKKKAAAAAAAARGGPAAKKAPPTALPPPAVNVTVQGQVKGGDPPPAQKAPTLEGFLHKYTAIEELGASDLVTCTKCQTQQEHTKKLSVWKLPNVLCMHLKRFDALAQRKIEDFVRFPPRLSMATHLHPTLQKQLFELDERSNTNGLGHGKSRSSGGQGKANEKLEAAMQFDLFATVVHKGGLNSGHYISYVRSGDCWFRCDDTAVRQVGLDDVLQCRAYLMFYCKRGLSYKPSADGL